jgi:hypothetical protein
MNYELEGSIMACMKMFFQDLLKQDIWYLSQVLT